MWWITGVPIWHECFMLYLIPLWRCFGSCVHKVFPHLSHSKTCQNRVCRTSASHWGWPCFWSTYLTSWSNGVPMRFDTILLNWSTLTVRSSWHAAMILIDVFFFNIFTEDWMIPFASFAQGLTKIGNNQFSIDLPKGFSWNESLSGHVVFKHV